MNNLSKQKSRYLNLSSVVNLFIIFGITIYISLFLYNSLTRSRQFSPDSMNYVDVARNIASGKGIVQSTLGFNQTFLFQWNSQIPTPFISQPPLYPLLIALLSHAGLTYADAALVLPAIAYGIVLLSAYILARDLYSEQAALLSICVLIIYAPLYLISKFAWTESIGIVFLLLSFLLLVKSCHTMSIVVSSTYSFCAGLATGLAFSTRYALLPLLLLGIVFIAKEHHTIRWKLQTLLPYMVGSSLLIALVLGHNLLSTGQIMPVSLPSNIDLFTNFKHAARALLGAYFSLDNKKMQAIFAFLLITISMGSLVVRRRTIELLNLFIYNNHFLLTFWVIGYSLFIILQRTIFHFDYVDERILSPAGVTFLILVVALLLKAIQPVTPRRDIIYSMLILIIFLVSVREILITLRQPNIALDQQSLITKSGEIELDSAAYYNQ